MHTAIPHSRKAFTLVEVTLAMGILAFSLVAILGLLPVALQAVSKAMNLSVQARILQASQTELLSTPFSEFCDTNGVPKNMSTTLFFDENGIPCKVGSGTIRYEITLDITGGLTGDGKEPFEREGFFHENKVFFDSIRAGVRPPGDLQTTLQSVQAAECIRMRRERETFI